MVEGKDSSWDVKWSSRVLIGRAPTRAQAEDW